MYFRNVIIPLCLFIQLSSMELDLNTCKMDCKQLSSCGQDRTKEEQSTDSSGDETELEDENIPTGKKTAPPVDSSKQNFGNEVLLVENWMYKWPCGYCLHRYKNQKSLISHMAAVHAQIIQATLIQRMKIPQKTAHAKKKKGSSLYQPRPSKCVVCNKVFQSSFILRLHQDNDHIPFTS